MKYKILILLPIVASVFLFSSCATIWDVQNLQNQINTLSSSVTTMDNSLNKMESEISGNIEAIDNLHYKIGSLGDRYTYLKNTVDSTLKEYENIGSLNEKIQNLQKELNSLTAQNNKNYTDLQIDLSKVKGNVSYYQLQLENALNSINDIRNTQDKFSNALSTLDDTISQINNNTKLDELSYRIISLNSEIESIEKSINNFSATNLSSSTIKLSDFVMLSAKVDSMKNKLSSLESLQNKIKEIQEKENILEENIAKMQINKNSLNMPYTYVKVQKGDTLYKIAQAYNTNIEEIEKLNNKSNANIYTDELLKLPIKRNFVFPFKGEIKVKISYGSFIDHSLSSWVEFKYTGNVISILPGRIEEISTNNVFGKYVKIYCGNYVNIIYGNLASIDVSQGDWVKEGKTIGRAENFKLAISINGDIKDPLKVLAIGKDMGTVTYYTEWDDGKNPTYPSFRITKMGTLAKDWQTIAADLTKLPLGSIVYIPYFFNMPNKGIFRVEDSGSAVNGNDIDIFISDIQKALKFKKNLEVYIIRKP